MIFETMRNDGKNLSKATKLTLAEINFKIFSWPPTQKYDFQFLKTLIIHKNLNLVVKILNVTYVKPQRNFLSKLSHFTIWIFWIILHTKLKSPLVYFFDR